MIGRRALLRGAAGTLPIPFLPSMARAATAPRPQRLLFWYVPNGIQMEYFTPIAPGFGYDLPSILEPLGPVQDDVSVLTGLSAKAGIDVIPGDHARGTGCFLTSTLIKFTGGDDIVNGVSVDQVAAAAIGGATAFPSLQLGLEAGPTSGACDSGYACAYSSHLSWAGPSTPLPNVTSAVVAWDRMFGGSQETPEQAERRRVLRTSVIDYVLQDAASWTPRLARPDALRLDEYLTGLRELEVLIQALADAVCEPVDAPGLGLLYEAHFDAMIGLMVTALSCDLTRVITFQQGIAGSNAVYDFLGISGAHHEISHHAGDPALIEQLRVIGQWEVGRFASLVQRLAAETTADGGRLLDDTLALFGSEIADGNAHAHVAMPVLLAGAGGGAHTPGQHIVYGAEEPVADLYVAMLDAVGVSVPSFGLDGTGVLRGLGSG